MASGFVYLIGAGPGDPGLLTVKGRDCIARAQVIVYDYLANQRLLDYAAPGTELIYAGKIGGAHNHEQRQINELLISKARSGFVIARLKGGDPFVFGRGGEECLALVEAGIPFEVVPGITAAIGAAAYAGIPLTHRGLSASLTLVTGHESPGKAFSQIDWEGIAPGTGTLVFYMGVKNLPYIVSNLIAHGRLPSTPVALIRWGTRPEQQVLAGTLAEIVDLARSADFKAPAITIVGTVVELRSAIRWFANRPLFGKGVLVTRSAEQAGEFASLLSTYGARVYEAPTINIVPASSFRELDEAIADLCRFDWIVFSSVNAVEHVFSRIHSLSLDTRAFGNCRICAVGPKTAAALRHYGIIADLVPADYKAEGVVAAMTTLPLEGSRILFPKGDRARDVIPDGLRQAGATVVTPVAYRNVTPESLEPSVIEAVESGAIDCVTFTSSSTVSNLAAIIGENRFLNLLSRVAVASIGPITSRTCRDLGLQVAIEPREYTLQALTDEIVSFYSQTKSP